MKGIYLLCLFSLNAFLVKGQTVINQMTINCPSVQIPYGTTISLSTTYTEYNAENEISIVSDPANSNVCFVASAVGNNNSNYFLARIIPNMTYAELSETLDAGYAGTRGGVLYFKYTEKYKSGTLSYRIYNYQRTDMIPVVEQVGEFSLPKSLGPNYFSLNLYKKSGFVGTNEIDSYYILEVSDENGEKSFLRFKYLTSLNN